MWINYRPVLQRFPRAHQSTLEVRGRRGRGNSWVMRAPTLMEPFLMPGEEGPAQGERGYKQWRVFALGMTQQWRSALGWFRPPPQAFLFAELLPPCHSHRASPQSPEQSSAWVCSPDPAFQPPAHVCSGGHPLRLGGQGWGRYPCAGLLCPVASDCCRVLFPQRMRLAFCPNWAPPVRAFPGGGGLSSLQIPPGLQAPSHCLSCSFSFFFLLPYLAQQESFLSF